MTASGRKLRILTWHVHGNYLYNLTQVPHDFYLLSDAARSTHYSGRSGTLPWGDNVHDINVDMVQGMSFDVVMFQSRDAWDEGQWRYLSEAQRRLPRIYIEHDPPQEHPTDTRHGVADAGVLLVHVTPFNALMWDSGPTPTRVIEHGVLPLSAAQYRGDLQRGIVVVNDIESRGRRLGVDVYRSVAARVPLSLHGMNSERVGGQGEVRNDLLPDVMAAHRFFFNPIRYTSLGLAVIEAMMVGLPIVGLATTEMVSVIKNGENGFIDTRPERLVEAMQQLLAEPGLARQLGQAARETAKARFNIHRFVDDWCDALRLVTS